MQLFPLFAQLEGRRVLIVGGGAVAERKAALLLGARAQIDIVAPELTPTLQQWAATQRVVRHAQDFAENLLDGCWLVIAATDDRALNTRIADAANARRIFVNVVDDAALSTFHVPAIVDRAPLVIAISSGGVAPMLARLAREHIESLIDHSWGVLATLLTRARVSIRTRYADLAARRRFYAEVLHGRIAQLVRQQRPDEAQAALDAALDSSNPESRVLSPGHVTLVGAGPGDPGLLTLNALRALNEADVILHDRLVSDAVLALARRDAERIDVGKVVGKHHYSQADIHEEMLRHARAGKRVVRVKGGDPFIFGRGGEEIQFLRAHGIAYSIVPGITAAIACAAYAGVPLTHRDHAQVVRFATAHRKRSEGEPDALTAGGETLAIYMGVAEFAAVRQRLLADGVAPRTPFAIVEHGTRPEQRVIVGTLDELIERAGAAKVHAPALLIVGTVAQLAAEHHWFGAKPL